MKLRFVTIIIALSLILCSCAVVPPAQTDTKDTGTTVPESSDTTNDENYGIMLPYETGPGYGHESVKSETIAYSYKHANMSMRVVDGWKYEIIESDEGTSPFGIKIYPEYKPNDNITVMYYPDRFSVCGTDLTEEDSTLYGISAKKGYYGGSQIWTYIAAGDYAIWNNISDGTFQLYRDDIELMIDSVSIADGIITPDEAKEFAADEFIKKFPEPHYMATEFEHNSGTWQVSLYLDSKYSILGSVVYLSYLGTFIAQEDFAIVD